MKKAFLTLVTLLALSAAFAQTKFPLRINCNEMDADVYINNKLYTKTMPNLTIQLPPAVYSIKIAKAGFNEFNQNVTVKAGNGGTLLNAVLQPLQAPAQVPAPNALLPMFPLNINSNVAGAQVYLNGKLSGQTPFGQKVIGGTYEIRVTAPGYSEFQQRMVVRTPTQVNAVLQGSSSQISISSNVNGAEVIINGNTAGRTPFAAQMPMGSYSVQVRSPGYLDFQQNVVVGNGPVQVNAVLQSLGYQVTVNANVQGALVLVNGQQVGQVPFMTALPPGNYGIIVRAQGFMDYQAQLSVNGPQTVNAILQSAMSSYQFKIPEAFLNRDRDRDKESGGRRNIQLWVDGVLDNDFAGQLTAGRHVLRFVSGGIAVETQVDIQVGRSYLFEPFIGINVK
jgi:hypothetical protein